MSQVWNLVFGDGVVVRTGHQSWTPCRGHRLARRRCRWRSWRPAPSPGSPSWSSDSNLLSISSLGIDRHQLVHWIFALTFSMLWLASTSRMDVDHGIPFSSCLPTGGLDLGLEVLGVMTGLEDGLPLDVVVGHVNAILHLLAGEDQRLLVLDLGLSVLDGMTRL